MDRRLLTLVELRRLGQQNPVDGTLSAAHGRQRHRAALVLKHAVLAVQVQTVEDWGHTGHL